MAKAPSEPSKPTDSPDTPAATIEAAIEQALEGKVARRELHQVAQRITQIAVSEQFSGPMPHPKHLREYDAILPGAAERILSMAERNLEHNIEESRRAHQAEIADQKRGMLLGASLFGLLIVAALTVALATGNAVLTGLFLGTAAIGGVGLFVRGRNGPGS